MMQVKENKPLTREQIRLLLLSQHSLKSNEIFTYFGLGSLITGFYLIFPIHITSITLMLSGTCWFLYAIIDRERIIKRYDKIGEKVYGKPPKHLGDKINKILDYYERKYGVKK